MSLEHRLSALLQLHLHSRLNTWLQWIGQGQLQTIRHLGQLWNRCYIQYIGKNRWRYHCTRALKVWMIQPCLLDANSTKSMEQRTPYIQFFIFHTHLFLDYVVPITYNCSENKMVNSRANNHETQTLLVEMQMWSVVDGRVTYYGNFYYMVQLKAPYGYVITSNITCGMKLLVHS